MVNYLRVVKFWSEIILPISNETCAARSFDFDMTRMVSDQIALHTVQLPLFIISIFHLVGLYCGGCVGTWGCVLVADDFIIETNSKREHGKREHGKREHGNYPCIR